METAVRMTYRQLQQAGSSSMQTAALPAAVLINDVWCPPTGYSQLVAALEGAARKAGVQFVLGAPVTNIKYTDTTVTVRMLYGLAVAHYSSCLYNL